MAGNRALNGPVYPKDSLHARGMLSGVCEYCSKIAALRWVLCMRETLEILKGESNLDPRDKDLLCSFEQAGFSEAQVN